MQKFTKTHDFLSTKLFKKYLILTFYSCFLFAFDIYFTELLYEKISDAGVSGSQRQARVRKVWRYLSEKIYYLRRKLPQHYVIYILNDGRTFLPRLSFTFY